MATEVSGKQEIETDVVVVGFGGAGAAAAITAHDAGARVVVLEKMSAGGGNTRLASGHILSPTSMEVVSHFEVLCAGKTPRVLLETYAEGAMKNKDWIREMGGETSVYPPSVVVLYPFPLSPSWPNIPGAEHMEFLKVVGDTGGGSPAVPLWKLLSANVQRRGIKVMTNTSATELTTDQNGKIVGVVAESEGKQIPIKAKKAVVLTCGGFAYNDAMKDTFLPLTPLYAVGNPGNTGDGITMAQKVGASLWHMYRFCGYLVLKTPEYEAAFQLRFHGPRFILVDKGGRRFSNETGWEPHEGWKALMIFMPRSKNYPHLPAYAIFDDVTKRKGPLYQVKSGANLDYDWSLDNSKEVAQGWITQGKTIAELAKKISVDEKTLTNTIARYNENCKAGRDIDFSRGPETLEPIATPPFYAIEMWPGMVTTSGGPRRDKEARVLDNQGKPIPRLYSAGELGSIWGFLHSGGSSLTEALVFGRIAGRNAAAEKPW